MRRGDIHWGEAAGWGRRPMLVVSRSASLDRRNAVTVAPVTRTVRGIRSELLLGRREGLPGRSVATCDNLLTVPKASLDAERSGRLPPGRIPELDRSLVYALGIRSFKQVNRRARSWPRWTINR